METPVPQQMAQTPFYVYHPDPQPDQRQHGHFVPQPFSPHYNASMAMHQEHMKPLSPHSPLTPRLAPQSQMLFPQAAYPQFMPTPVVSPQPISHRPTILIERQSTPLKPIDTDCGPATPALSTSGSTISSPPSSCGMLATPVNGPSPAPENLVGVKQGCEVEVLSEILAGGELSRCQSPPLTPSKCPQSHRPHHSRLKTCLNYFLRYEGNFFAAPTCSKINA